MLNQQGDVIRIVNNEGVTVAEYRYDAWGNVIYSNGSMAAINPIRYRGYYYDTETGFYYLQSRYYDPSIGRFINADSFASTGQGFLGFNMFAYCGNDPVGNADPSGHAWWGTNTVAICDGGLSGIIYNQHNEPYGEMKLESATVSHGGCGPVAVQNAMQLLGNYSTSLEEIIDYYKKSNGFS